MTKVLDTQNLSVGYEKNTVVSNINLTVRTGEIFSIIGKNGCGKSTLIRTVSGLQKKLDGKAEIMGKDVSRYKPSELAKTVSVVLTERIPDSLATGFDIVSAGRIPYTGIFGGLSQSDKQIINDAVELTGTQHIVGKKFDLMSDGERQKILIARAMVQQPKLIILDEPTSHLDISHKLEVMRILQRLAKENHIAVLMSLHDIFLALKFSDKIAVINSGEVTAVCGADKIDKELISHTFSLSKEDIEIVFGNEL